MRRIVLVYGLIAGAILSAMLALASLLGERYFAHGMTIGYTTMVLAFVLVYFGVRSYRDGVGGGTISFWRAFGIGAGIVTVAGVCYVATWMIVSAYVWPDFMDRYAEYTLNDMRASGAAAEKIAATERDFVRYREMYANPFVKAGITFLEVTPVGLVMTLVSAALLRRRERARAAGGAVAVA